MSERRVILEAVVESADAAVAAEAARASRLELCVNLHEGGTTPPVDLVDAVVARVSIPVVVMIRPRAGGFVYTDEEMAFSLRQIDDLRDRGIAGIVVGVLRANRAVDVEATRRLVSQARGLPVTFHRACDETPDLAAALEEVIAAGAARILTSGGAATATEGASRIAALVAQARGRIAVLAGGGIRAHNVAELIARTAVREVHARFESIAGTRAVVDLL